MPFWLVTGKRSGEFVETGVYLLNLRTAVYTGSEAGGTHWALARLLESTQETGSRGNVRLTHEYS